MEQKKRSMSSGRKACCRLSKASPASSDWIRSGLSCITCTRDRVVRAHPLLTAGHRPTDRGGAHTSFILSCFWLDCHLGTRCIMCWQSCPFPAILQAWHTSSIWKVWNTRSLVVGSLILMSRV